MTSGAPAQPERKLLKDILGALAAYQSRFGSPTGNIALLEECLKTRRITSRTHFPLHVTAGAAAVDEAGSVLQVLHAALGRWVLPGGHLERADGSLFEAARRELLEETGLEAHPHRGSAPPVPVDVDVHAIPASTSRNEPRHFHANFLYLVGLPKGAVSLDTEEVTGFRWVPVPQIDPPSLAARLREEALRQGWL